MYKRRETYDEMTATYMKYHGLRDELEINPQDFEELLDNKRSHKCLRKRYGHVPEKDHYEMFNILDGYCKETGCDPKDIDLATSTSGVKRSRSRSLSNNHITKQEEQKQ